ncbi:MAG: hypothetical protein ACTSPQ_05735 [Candidatus Helarchaeota archaeon]
MNENEIKIEIENEIKIEIENEIKIEIEIEIKTEKEKKNENARVYKIKLVLFLAFL